MAMPSGNAVISDKMQFPSNGGPGGEIHPRQWFPDERDGFISWLRGEFAAANAIIDSLCHHLRSISNPGEYDFVIGTIQQRRYNWNAILHMQQYFPVAEVIFALQQVKIHKEQKRYDQPKFVEKDSKKIGQGYRQVHKVENVGDNHNSISEHRLHKSNSSEKEEEKAEKAEEKDVSTAELKQGTDGTGCNSQTYFSLKKDGDPVGSESDILEAETLSDSKGTGKDDLPKSTSSDPDEKQKPHLAPKVFVGLETLDGKSANVVEGLKLYEDIFEGSEVSKLFFLANELRASGRRGALQGQAYVISKRPMKGHGREMIQLGPQVTDGPPEDDNSTGTSKDRKLEAIPNLLQDVIDRLLQLQIVSVKPDSCIIDFFNEGDHSHPQIYPPWYGRPVCVLFLNDCDMVFGRVIGVEHPGDYKGSLKVSLAAGSLLVVQGKSADFSKHAIPSLRKQRILITLMKCQPKKSVTAESLRLSPSPLVTTAPPPTWGPQPSRSPSLARHPAGPKHFGVVPTTGVLPAPPIRPQHLPPPNGIQPLFVAAPVSPAVPFPAPVPLPPASAAWQPVPPRHSAPRPPVPGTGVFLPPPGSGHSTLASQQLAGSTVAEGTVAMETIGLAGSESNSEKLNSTGEASPKGKSDGKVHKQECNGKLTGKDEQQNAKKKVSSKPTGTVK